MSKLYGRIFGTFFGVGFIPVIPATWTSLVVALLFYFTPMLHEWPAQVAFVVLSLVLGIPACTRLEHEFGTDPKQATMDEACGMAIAMIAIPMTPLHVAAAFFLFRLFDVIKLPPARQLEDLHGGMGIMMDDVAAGVQSRLVMFGVVWVIAALGL